MKSEARCLPRIASLSMLLFLAACGGQTLRAPADAPLGAEPQPLPTRPVAKSGGVTQKRGGGYYKDDGPGDDIPDNLDDIPDAFPRVEPLHRFANNPYVVLGKSYVPDTRLKPFKQRGIASWYGKKFHGQKTSIGEPYDMFSMTAAHPTLAIPSYVRVSNPGNGKSVVVRVTDRGPFHSDRIIDLSYAAAYRLGYINNGSTLVDVEAILPDDMTAITYAQSKLPISVAKKPSVSSEPDEIEVLTTRLAGNVVGELPVQSNTGLKGVFIQLGAFSNVDNAESLRSHLLRELDWLSEGIQISAGAGMHRVHLGPYASRGDAERVAEKIRLALGYKPSFVTR